MFFMHKLMPGPMVACFKSDEKRPKNNYVATCTKVQSKYLDNINLVMVFGFKLKLISANNRATSRHVACFKNGQK